ncbi:hypothetical protein [Actinoplanes siamensis]|uniref:Uncharacterized protein n=1 Tax=Actinoplanes siamensis TaxID=1223317 RepID=A0A919NEC7_9ACTN|nr:hypothetical protein [Actinoplanes siamensis]GIF09170.1 hypothetical protein Asi03nite_67080 [Actinoplanes siamensis]
MTRLRFHISEVFDIPARGGLIAVGRIRDGEIVGVPRLRDDTSGNLVHVLAIDHPTPRTRRTGETILVVDRADAEYVEVGRIWTVEG